MLHPILTTLTLLISLVNAAPSWPIYFSKVAPADDKIYDVNPEWLADHIIGTKTYLLNAPGEADYAVFRCQFFCNTLPDCISIFVSFDNNQPGSENAWAQCLEFDKELDPALYVLHKTKSLVPLSGYNKFSSN